MPHPRSAAVLLLILLGLGVCLPRAAAPPPAPGRTRAGASPAPAPPPELLDGCVVASLDELAEWAERVVRGRVVATRCAWSEDRSTIYTHVTVAVDEALGGPVRAGSSLTVRVLGGTIPEDDVRLDVSHQPRLAVGDEAILFVDDDPGLRTQLVGDCQGVLRLVDGPGGRALQDGFGRAVAAVGASGRLLTGARAEPRALDDVLGRLRRISRRRA